MLTKVLNFAAEATAEVAVFILAFFLSTGMTCSPKATCDAPQAEVQQAHAP